MENKHDILIWKYLDDECSAEEKNAFEELLLQDKSLAEAFHSAQQLHQQLSSMEAEEPSMRFQTNLIEQLPTLYRPIQTSADLLPPRIVRWFSTLIGMTAFTCLGLFFTHTPMMRSSLHIVNGYTLNLGIFANPMVFTAFIGSLAVLSYFLMDFIFKKWFLKATKK